MLSAGELDKRIIIERRTDHTEPTYGAAKPQWETFAERWAAIETGGGREYWRAFQTKSELTHTIRLHHLPGVTSKMRVRFFDPRTGTTHLFNIAAALNPKQANRETHLHVTETAPHG